MLEEILIKNILKLWTFEAEILNNKLACLNAYTKLSSGLAPAKWTLVSFKQVQNFAAPVMPTEESLANIPAAETTERVFFFAL